MTTERVTYIPIWKCKSCDQNTVLLAVVTQAIHSPGPQDSVTLHADSNIELVKALRVHPDYQSHSVKALLAFVREATNGTGELTIKLIRRQRAMFIAVLKCEGINVWVSSYRTAEMFKRAV